MAGNRPMLATAARFAALVDRSGECWLWKGAALKSGYGSFAGDYRGRGQSRTIYAHRYALEQAMGSTIPAGFYCLHTCDSRLCVRNDEIGTYEVDGVLFPRWGHLWLGTHGDNVRDMHRKGRAPYPGAKLSRDQVSEIRLRLREGAVPNDLAVAFGVTADCIRQIRRGDRWKNDEA